MTSTPEVCFLAHRGFTALSSPLFRRAEDDGVPVMVVSMGGQDAALPLTALVREFALPDSGTDRRMLGLIAEALDYVVGLRLGDPLPAEVLGDGGASWATAPLHQQIASARLHLQLVQWLAGVAGTENGPLTPEVLLASVEDPTMRPRVQESLREAAAQLGLASGEAVSELVEAFAEELAYIEALRDQLLAPMRVMVDKLHRLALANGDRRGDSLVQVQHLSRKALGQTASRFDEIDGQTGEILPALRNAGKRPA